MSKNREQNRALAAALRSAGHKDVRPVWAQAKELLNTGLTYEQVASKLGVVSEPKPTYTVGKPTVAAKQRKPAASKRAKAAKPKPKPRKPGRVRESQAQYAGAGQPEAYPVSLAREDAELSGTLQVWPARARANGQKGVTHTAALMVDGVVRKLTVSKKALNRLVTGVGTLLWWEGQGHVATLA